MKRVYSLAGTLRLRESAPCGAVENAESALAKAIEGSSTKAASSGRSFKAAIVGERLDG